jgi:hypothetical protein
VAGLIRRTLDSLSAMLSVKGYIVECSFSFTFYVAYMMDGINVVLIVVIDKVHVVSLFCIFI